MTATGNDFITNVETRRARERFGGNVPPLPGGDADEYLELLRLAGDADDDAKAGDPQPPTISYEAGSENANAQALRTWDRDRRKRWQTYRKSPRYDRSREAASAAATLAGAAADLTDCPGGQRNSTLNAKARKLGRYVNAGLLDRVTVETALCDACRGNGLLRDDGDGAVRATIASGLDSAARDKIMPLPLRERPRGGSLKGVVINTFEPSDSDDEAPTELADLASVDTAFWESRESLRNIYNSALAKMCSPWAVLAVCVARALATVRPHITLPGLVGGPGSLNWFGAIAATSGGGKGAASATARMLVTDPVQQRNTGSGEGMIGAYVRPADATTGEPKGLHESLMFNVDEIDSLTAQSNRSGATTMSVLRSAFSGETLGFSYVNKNTPTLDAHSYRMTLIVSVQPQRAARLLDDAAGGTPQRFMWFPGTDGRITTDAAGDFVAPLTLPKPGTWQYPTTLRVPQVARELILDTRAQAARGERDALDSHSLFVREKFAFALALLDGRTEMTVEDWELSGVAAAVSDRTRDQVIADIEQATEDDSAKRGTLQGISAAAANVAKGHSEWKRANRISTWIVEQLTAAGPQGMTEGALKRLADSPDRPSIVPTLHTLADAGVVKTIDRLKGDRLDRWVVGQ